MAALKYFFSLIMIPVSIILAGTAVAAYLAGETTPDESAFITFLGLGMPVILIINLIILVYWLAGKRWWAIVPLSGILLNIGYLTSILQITVTSAELPVGKQSIRVASYNVGKFKSWEKFETQHYISEFLKTEQVNVACLVEYREDKNNDAATLSRLLNLPYHAITYLPGSTTLGIGIFSKYPIVNSGRLPFDSKTNDAMWADIQVGEQTVRLIACHLQTTNFSRKRKLLDDPVFQNTDIQQKEEAVLDITKELTKNFKLRAAQADLVRQVIDTTDLPTIVCGDFNDTPSSYTYHRIKGKMNDSFRTRGNGYGYTFRGIRHLLRIDYILYSKALECIDYHSPEKEWSDHNPVISEFYLK